MKKTFTILTIATIALLGTFASCKKKDKSVAVSEVTLNHPTANLAVGDTLTLTATVLPQNATDKTITWTSSSAGVASVANGKITAHSEGSAIITVTTRNGNKTANCSVTVAKAVVPSSKTVSVGTQNGTLNQGLSGTITYDVTTENIANANYTTPVVNNLPTGVTVQGGVQIVGGSGKLTLVGSSSIVQGTTTTLTLTIDSTTSSPFSITIGAAINTVSVQSQRGDLVEGTAGTALYAVNLKNFSSNEYTIQWFEHTNATDPISAPEGITTSMETIATDSNELSIKTTTGTPNGRYYFRITMEGAVSNTQSLFIDEAPNNKSISLQDQIGIPVAGTAGSAVYYVYLTDITTWDYTVKWYAGAAGTTSASTPTGVTTTLEPVGSDAADLTIKTTTSTPSGTFYFSLTMEGTESGIQTFIVDPAPKSVVLEDQGSIPVTGTASTATYAVRVTSIAAGTSGTVKWYSNAAGTTSASEPTGVTVNAGNVMINGATATVRITTTASTSAVVRFFTVTYDGVESNVQPFVILPAGDGSASSPFIVNNVDALRKVGTGTDGWGLDKHYRQAGSIVLTPSLGWTPIGTNSARFTGSYDGNGYSISSLTIASTTYGDYQGLFGAIGTGGEVRNVALRSVNITPSANLVGGIAALNAGTIKNCYVAGIVKGWRDVGGIVGENRGLVENCYTTGSVTGDANFVGGIAGYNNTGAKIQNCYSTGAISGANEVGGIVGSHGAGTVERCVAMNTSITATSGTKVGRVAGDMSGTATMSNNFRRDVGMTISDQTGEINPSSSLSGIQGSGVSASNTHGNNSGTWWTTTSGSWPVSFSTTSWDVATGRLPWLKTNTGGAFVATQNPTP